MAKILLVTGPPASGKSTIARLLAQHFPKSLHLQVDHLREMMVNGIQLPGAAWNDAAVPAEFVDHYAALGNGLEVYRVLLLPTAAALISRLQSRGNPFDQFLIDAVPWLYSFLEPMPKDGWLVIDSSDWTIDQTLQEVLRGIDA